MTIEPEIRYVRSSDGTTLATATAGSGPPLLMMMPTGLGSIETTFAVPEWRASVEALARHFTFITYDPRGQGLSDRDDSDLSLETRVADLWSVATNLQLPRFNLLGRGLTGPTSIAFTAEHPELVERLALWAAPATPWMRLSERMRTIAAIANVDWPLYCKVLALIDFGWTDGARIASDHLAASISAETLAKNWRDSRRHDATEYLARITCPTLVVYPKGMWTEERLGIEAMRAVAASIPGAVFRTSDAYSPYFGGDVVDTQLLVEFLLGAGADGRAGSETAIILFTDIADSTALTERLGDANFRNASRLLDEGLRKAALQRGGAVVDAKTLGDGMLVTFTSASQAIDAARSFVALAEDADLPIHVGVHAGDVIREQGNVFGGAVNIAARICALSAPGEILVSDVVRGMARTSASVAFEDRGAQEMKGVGDPVRVYAVQATNTKQQR